MALTENQNAHVATPMPNPFLNDRGPVGEHLLCVPVHLASGRGHHLLHPIGGLLRGQGDTKMDAGLRAQIHRTHEQPGKHGA